MPAAIMAVKTIAAGIPLRTEFRDKVTEVFLPFGKMHIKEAVIL